MVLSDFERRVLANLSIPRSAEALAHTVTVDPHTVTDAGEQVITARDVLGVLHVLEDRGWVTNLGECEDADAVMDAVDGVLPMHEEKAANYSELVSPREREVDGAVLTKPARRGHWLEGELWYMTAAGLDALTGV